jgi:hypothetical protein
MTNTKLSQPPPPAGPVVITTFVPHHFWAYIEPIQQAVSGVDGLMNSGPTGRDQNRAYLVDTAVRGGSSAAAAEDSLSCSNSPFLTTLYTYVHGKTYKATILKSGFLPVRPLRQESVRTTSVEMLEML